MAAFDRVVRACAFALVWVSSCVPPLSESGRPCPCTSAYVCCAATQTCEMPGACAGGAPDAPSSAPESSISDAQANPSLDGFDVKGADAAVVDGRQADGQDAVAPSDPDADGSASDGRAPDASVSDARAPDASASDASTSDVKPYDASTPDAGASDADGAIPRDASPPNECWSQPRKSNVLVITYDPYLVNRGHSLRAEIADWQDPAFLSVRLAEQIRNGSHGSLNYDIVEFRNLNAWPKQMPDSAPLDETTFFQGPPPGSFTNYDGGNADYKALFESQALCSYMAANDVSEVWIWGAVLGSMSFGFDDFAFKFRDDKVAGRPAADVDPVLYARRRKNIPDCGRTVSVMGFLYTTGFDPRAHNLRVGEMLQFTLGATLLEGGTRDDRWDRFGRYALAWPNDVHVGTPAFPPNGGLGMPPETQAWDYANHSTVMSAADDWLAYPALTGVKKPIDCTAWGCSGDGFQAWYASHLPHTAGGVLERGCNNWWKYVADVDGTLPRCTGDACGPAYATGWPCAVDDQCASRHCSCQGSHMLCSEGSGPACPRANWEPCTVDQDCMSGVCGCNWGPPPKQCLPDARYPRDCTPPL